MLRAPCHVPGGNGWACGRWRAGTGAIFGRSLLRWTSLCLGEIMRQEAFLSFFSRNSEMIGSGLFSFFKGEVDSMLDDFGLTSLCLPIASALGSAWVALPTHCTLIRYD